MRKVLFALAGIVIILLLVLKQKSSQSEDGGSQKENPASQEALVTTTTTIIQNKEENSVTTSISTTTVIAENSKSETEAEKEDESSTIPEALEEKLAAPAPKVQIENMVSIDIFKDFEQARRYLRMSRWERQRSGCNSGDVVFKGKTKHKWHIVFSALYNEDTGNFAVSSRFVILQDGQVLSSVTPRDRRESFRKTREFPRQYLILANSKTLVQLVWTQSKEEKRGGFKYAGNVYVHDQNDWVHSGTVDLTPKTRGEEELCGPAMELSYDPY